MTKTAETKRAWVKWAALVAVLGAGLAIGALRMRHGSDAATGPAPASSSSSSEALQRSPENDPPAGDAAVALLGGLKPNDDVAGWKVKAITRSSAADMKDAIAVSLEKPKQSFIVWIAVKQRLEHHPAVETKGYALYFGAFNPPMQEGEAQPAVDAIAARVIANESKTSAAGLL